MATLEITPEAIPSLRRKKWTVDEYDRLADAGFLPGRYELIDGEMSAHRFRSRCPVALTNRNPTLQ
jgi:hypothetical protein